MRLISLFCLLFSLSAWAQNYVGPYDVNVASLVRNEGWDGPATTIEKKNGSATFIINGERHPLIHISLNPQGIQNEEGWRILITQVDKALEHGIPLIDLMAPNTSENNLAELNEKLGNRKVFVTLRFDLNNVENAGLDQRHLVGMNGLAHTPEGLGWAYNGTWIQIPLHPSLSEDWITAQVKAMGRIVGNLIKSGLSKRVIALRPMAFDGGEWFEVPLTMFDGKLVQATPDTNNPFSKRDKIFILDRHPKEAALYANWLSKNHLSPGKTTLPTPEELNQTDIGLNILSNSSNQVPQSAYYYNLFRSYRMSHAQLLLAEALKIATGHKALVDLITGYLLSNEYYNHSNHLGLDLIYASPLVDMISGPWGYLYRKAGQPMIPEGPMDSTTLAGKLYRHEDDTRPYWYVEVFNGTTTFAENISIVQKNTLTAIMHGTSTYLFDLPNLAWIYRDDKSTEGHRMLSELKHLMSVEEEYKVTTSDLFQNEVAIFVDDTYAALQPFPGPGGDETYPLSTMNIGRTAEAIAKTGTAPKYYRLADIRNKDIDLSHIKVAYILGGTYMNAATKNAIKSKLMTGNRTVVFQGYPGLVAEALVYREANFTDITGMTGVLHTAGIQTPDFKFSPWIEAKGYDDVLAENPYNSQPVTVRKNFGGYNVVFLTYPQVSTALHRRIIQEAGVHLFANNAVVEQSKNLLMVHTVSNTETPSVSLPGTYTVEEITIKGTTVVCSKCSSFKVTAGETSTHLYRIGGASAPTPTPTPTPTPGSNKLPSGFFRDVSGLGVIGKTESSYCMLDSGDHMKQCGLDPAIYGTSQIIKLLPEHQNLGLCDCKVAPTPTPTPTTKLPLTFFRNSAGGGVIGKSDTSYCTLDSGDHMKQCGYDPATYGTSQIITILPEHVSLGSCKCDAAPVPTPTDTKLPLTFFRNSIGGGLVGKTESSYCSLDSGEHMKECGFDPATYGSGQIIVMQPEHQYLGSCQCKAAPAPTPTVTKLPLTFFRSSVGGGIIGKSESTYCTLDSGEHMKQCGYDPATYGTSQIITILPQHTSLGSCQCSVTPTPTPTVTKLPLTFFRNPGGAGIIGKSDTTYCTLDSGEHMRECGYDPAIYGTSQIINLQPEHISLGLCQCKAAVAAPAVVQQAVVAPAPVSSPNDLPLGFFRSTSGVGQMGKSVTTYCTMSTTKLMKQCGFDPYQTGKVVKLLSSHISLGACKCN